jgi:hypothetical protein
VPFVRTAELPLPVELLQANRSQEEVEQLKHHIFSARTFFERGKASGCGAMSKIADHGLAIITNLLTLFEEREQGSPAVWPPMLREIASRVGDADYRLGIVTGTSKTSESRREGDMLSNLSDGAVLTSDISDFHSSLAASEAPALDHFLTDTQRWFESISETEVGRSCDAVAANETFDEQLTALYDLGLVEEAVQPDLY